MNINSVNIHSSLLNCRTFEADKIPNSKSVYDSNIQKSLYKNKGMNIYFGCLAKGADIFENECIDLLRSLRLPVKRRFSEYDITDIVEKLKVVKQQEDKKNILMEALELDEEYTGKIPSAEFFKKVVGLVAHRPEQERFAILEFAADELKNATKPLETFSKLSAANQDNLCKLLVEIDDVNRQSLFKNDEARENIVGALYDTFRVPMYAQEDISKIDSMGRTVYKNENLQILKEDMDFYKKQDVYADETAKSRILDVVEHILSYYEQNV